MYPEQESFEDAQRRALGRKPKIRLRLVGKLKSLDWWKILRSSLFTSFFLVLALRSLLEKMESGVSVFIGIALGVFVLVTLRYFVAEVDPLYDENSET
jgi:hypothetical protein